MRLDADGTPTTPPRRLTTGLSAASISVSRSGTRLAYAVFSETSNVWSLPIPSAGTASVTQAKPVTSGSQVIEHFDISNDGQWLTFDSNRGGNSDIYRIPLSGTGEPEQLTRTVGDEFWSVWSPDGREIAFHAFREGHRQIYLMPATGGPPALVAQTNRDDRAPIWRPEGRALIVSTDNYTPHAESRIISRSESGAWEPPARWRLPGCLALAWSPDGRLVACYDPDGLMLITPGGDSVRTLVKASVVRQIGQTPAWSADGRTVYYIDTDSIGTAIFAVAATGGGPSRAVMRFDDPTRPWHRFGFQVSHGRFYFTVGDRQSDVWVAEVEKK